MNLGCFVVDVVDVIVCLVRLALVCLKLVKEFVQFKLKSKRHLKFLPHNQTSKVPWFTTL